MASTAGRRSSRVKTERTEVTISDFQKEIEKLEDDRESKNILVYGDSNAGKTVLAGTLPGRNFWLVGEPGYKTAKRVVGATGFIRRIPDTATAWAAVDWLEQNNRYEKFDWVVLDGLSTMQDRFRLGYAAEAFDIDSTKRQHRNLPDRPDYFNTQNFLKAWIPRFIDMNVNFLITAHAYRTDETENGELLVFPGVQGKVTETANAISGLMDATGYFESKRIYSRDGKRSKINRRLWFESPERKMSKREQEVRYIVGDKFNCLGPYIDNPTMPGIIARIDGVEE